MKQKDKLAQFFFLRHSVYQLICNFSLHGMMGSHGVIELHL